MENLMTRNELEFCIIIDIPGTVPLYLDFILLPILHALAIVSKAGPNGGVWNNMPILLTTCSFFPLTLTTEPYAIIHSKPTTVTSGAASGRSSRGGHTNDFRNKSRIP